MTCYCGGCPDCLTAQGFDIEYEEEICLYCGVDMPENCDYVFGPYCSLECEQRAKEPDDPSCWSDYDD